MNEYARKILINNFIEKLDEAVEAMVAIEDFKYEVSFGIASESDLKNVREDVVKRIDDIWIKYGMK